MTTIPVQPAAYIRTDDSEDSLAEARSMMIQMARRSGWPEPAVYIDIGPAAEPGRQYAALVEAITAGRHDAVLITHPKLISRDLADIEAFDRLCRRLGVRVHLHWGHELANLRSLFDVIRDTMRFTVTEEHLRLLRRAYVSWDETEFGAPAINGKRPYGNSNVYADIAEILGIPEAEWFDDGNPFPEAEWRFLRLHVETGVALQIALATGEFRPGRYIRAGGEEHTWKRDEG
jgi:resolvase-like protein